MAVIQGGTSGAIMDVGSTSKGAYVELVDASGRKWAPVESYMAQIDITPATTLSDGTTYWTMRNTGAKLVLIRRLELILAFTGTAAASVSSYRIERFSGATPTGGTAITIVKKKNSFTASTVGDIRTAPAGLTTTSVVFEAGGMTRVMHMNQLQHIAFDLSFTGEGEVPKFELASGEGLAIRANGTLVAGTRMVGCISWDER
jgi:hypothetical protein